MQLGSSSFPPDSSSERDLHRSDDPGREHLDRGKAVTDTATFNRDIGMSPPEHQDYQQLQDQQRMLMGPSVNEIQKAQHQLSPGFATAGGPYENPNHRFYPDRMPPMRGVG